MKSITSFKIVIVGCGDISEKWVSYISKREDCIILSLVDVLPEKAHKLVEKYKLSDVSVYSNIERAFDANSPNLVIDITPTEIHNRVVASALISGAQVFGEYPMARNIAECQEIISACENTNNSYSIIQPLRYSVGLRTIKNIIESNVIGEIEIISVDYFNHLKSIEELEIKALDVFDQVRLITNSNAKSVCCNNFTLIGDTVGKMTANCVFEMSNGIFFMLRICGCSNGMPSSDNAEWRITGSKGTIIWDGVNLPFYEMMMFDEVGKIWVGKKVRAESRVLNNVNFEGCLDEMFDSLIAGRDAETCFKDNVNSVSMLFAAKESVKNETKVKVHIFEFD